MAYASAISITAFAFIVGVLVVFGAGRLAQGTARAGVWTKPATALQLGECFRVIVYATACQMQVPAVFAGAKPPRDDAGAASAVASVQAGSRRAPSAVARFVRWQRAPSLGWCSLLAHRHLRRFGLRSPRQGQRPRHAKGAAADDGRRRVPVPVGRRRARVPAARPPDARRHHLTRRRAPRARRWASTRPSRSAATGAPRRHHRRYHRAVDDDRAHLLRDYGCSASWARLPSVPWPSSSPPPACCGSRGHRRPARRLPSSSPSRPPTGRRRRLAPRPRGEAIAIAVWLLAVGLATIGITIASYATGSK